MTKTGLSETLAWHTRAAQARRVATMLPPKDAELIETFAKECEQRAQQIVMDGVRSETRRSIGPLRPRDQVFQSASEGIPQKRAALAAHVRTL